MFKTLAQQPKPAQTGKPNIVVVMGDESVMECMRLSQGMRRGTDPQIDKLAEIGMVQGYPMPGSCNRCRADLSTRNSQFRMEMTQTFQGGATLGLPAEAATVETVLKSMGYHTG